MLSTIEYPVKRIVALTITVSALAGQELAL